MSDIRPKKRYGIDMNYIREPSLQKYFSCGFVADVASVLLVLLPVLGIVWVDRVLAWAAPAVQPELLFEDAEALVVQSITHELLIWDGITLPLLIPKTEQSRLARWLSVLAEERLVSREESIQMIDESNGRRRIAALWQYRSGPGSDWIDSPDGQRLQYGHPALKRVVSVSPAYWVDDAWYAEVYLEWYVEALSPWARLPLFKQQRLFRRSAESFDKPFVRTVYLQFDEDGWHDWRGHIAATGWSAF